MPKKDDTETHDKPCTVCGTPRQILVRCQIDESGKWHFVCPGKCWKQVSGGVEDAKGFENEYPYYRYGGMWKNKHADGPISAKKPKKVKERQKQEASDQVAAREAGQELIESQEHESFITDFTIKGASSLDPNAE